MTKSLIFAALWIGTLAANPFMEYVEISEFQTAPRQCIELYGVFLPWHPPPYDIGGAVIVTNAGTAIVDTGVRFLTNPSFVVLDSTNTSGTFSLGVDSDYIRAYVPVYGGMDTFPSEVRYPCPNGNSWAPPTGASASMFGSFMGSWYVDLSPTFGDFNDDDGGGLWGFVCDHGGITGATVRMQSVYGCGTATLVTVDDSFYGPGYFARKPTGPGRFVVTVECAGYLPYTYPETIELAANEDRQINIYLQPAGAVEESALDARLVGLYQRGRALVLTADRAGTVLVSVYDNLGRVRMSERVALVSGSNELALPSLRSGVYFASCRFGDRTLKTKLVLY